MSDQLENLRVQNRDLIDALEQVKAELHQSHQRQRELTDQVMCLRHAISIITNPPPPAPVDPLTKGFLGNLRL